MLVTVLDSAPNRFAQRHELGAHFTSFSERKRFLAFFRSPFRATTARWTTSAARGTTPAVHRRTPADHSVRSENPGTGDRSTRELRGGYTRELGIGTYIGTVGLTYNGALVSPETRDIPRALCRRSETDVRFGVASFRRVSGYISNSLSFSGRDKNRGKYREWFVAHSLTHSLTHSLVLRPLISAASKKESIFSD